MSEDRNKAAYCVFCVVTAYVTPWGLLGAGALIGLFGASPYWQETAAWLSVLGIGCLALSYFWARLVHTLEMFR